MSESPPPPSLSRAREHTISELSQYFANDDLSLEDLERRIERVYKAANATELDLITSDLRSAAPLVEQRGGGRNDQRTQTPSVPSTFEIVRARVLAVMSHTRRAGRWTVPRELNIFALMSDTRIDLTRATLPIGGVVTIHVTAVMAAFKLIVPPGVYVINELHSFMADVGNSTDELMDDTMAPSSSPVIRITGTAFMAEAKVKVRRREDPVYDDDDDG